MIHSLTIGPEWFYHPLGQCAGNHIEVIRCKSYNWWSGIEGNVTLLAWLGGIGAILHHLECHEPGCHRHGKYKLEGGIRCCKKHHPALDKREVKGEVHRIHLAHLNHIGACDDLRISSKGSKGSTKGSGRKDR